MRNRDLTRSLTRTPVVETTLASCALGRPAARTVHRDWRRKTSAPRNQKKSAETSTKTSTDILTGILTDDSCPVSCTVRDPQDHRAAQSDPAASSRACASMTGGRNHATVTFVTDRIFRRLAATKCPP